MTTSRREPPTQRGMARRPAARRPHDERGAALILALVLLLVGSVAAGALSFEVTTGLANTGRFGAARSLEYAARSATDVAIQNIRYTPLLSPSQTLEASPPAPCWGSSPISEVSSIDNAVPMASWCSTAWAPTSAATRTVTISTCPATVAAAACAATPYLQAVVVFDDYPPGVSAPTTTQCQVYCGTSMSIESWLWSPAVPSVTSISPSGGPAAGGTTVQIAGSGFAPGDTVSFVEESGGTPTAGNVVLQVPSSSVTINSSSSISVASPSITQGSTYFVVVNSPSGTSPHGGADVFTYTLSTPTIASLTPNSGVTAGGNLITVTGTGFMTPAIVRFVPESGGVPVSGGTVLTGQFVDVVSSTSLTVVCPGTTSGSTYFVTVSTPAGITAETSASVFTYEYIVPTVNAVAPDSGPNAGGTTITITGTGFITGSTVSFVRESSGCTTSGALAASNVVVVNATTITASSPPVSAAAPYYVYVTTTSGSNHYSSSCFPIFSYTG